MTSEIQTTTKPDEITEKQFLQLINRYEQSRYYLVSKYRRLDKQIQPIIQRIITTRIRKMKKVGLTDCGTVIMSILEDALEGIIVEPDNDTQYFNDTKTINGNSNS